MRRATIAEITSRLGKPKIGTSNLVRLKLPYTMSLAWDRKVKINSILVHPIIREPLGRVLTGVCDNYTHEEIKSLGLDLFGGCYNYRAERGGKEWSRHAWAIAIDIDPANNQLSWRADKARLDDPEYKMVRDLFRANGFVSLGELSNYDWMHFEASYELIYNLKF